MRQFHQFAIASTIAIVAASSAQASAQMRMFDIEAQSAATGILQFARQAGIQIIAPEEATRGQRTAAVNGSMEVSEGIRRLIGGSGLRIASFDGRTVVLAPATVRQEPQTSQTTPAQSEQTAPDISEDAAFQDIIVTGTRARGATVLTSSSAITVATREDLDRKVPRSTAQALELVPGIFVEGSGGEVSNNYSVRGLAGGGQQFVQIQEDGLPIFYINALSDTILKQELYIDRLEAVRSGASGVLTVNGAGATINFLTRKPDFERSGGSFQVSTSSFGTARVDAFMSRPIAEDTAIAIGGFFRSDNGIRDPGYAANQGFILRGAISQRFAGGQLTISGKIVDDHNIFYVPIPVTGVGKPESIPGLSATNGLLQSRDFGRVRARTTPTTGSPFTDIDLSDGVHTKSWSLGYDLTYDASDQISLFARGRYTDFGTDFQSIFSYDNSALQLASERLQPTNASTALLLQRFAPQGATGAGIRYLDTGQIVAGAAALDAINGNGLIAESVIGDNRAKVVEFNSDTGLRWQTDNNSLAIGALFTKSSRYNDAFGASTFVTDVQDRARRVDIVALNPAGQVVGQLTENGFLNYGTFGEGLNRLKFTSISVYANNELRLGDLRIDGGIRYERFDLDRSFGVGQGRTPIAGAGIFAPDGTLIQDFDNIIANNYYAQFGGDSFSGREQQQERKFDKIAWTVGANYLLTPDFAAYARYARGFQAQEQNKPTDLDFAEVGLRYSTARFQASISGFHTRFLSFPFSRQNRAGVEVIADSDIEVWGGEFDVTVRPVDWFRIQAVGVIQESKLAVNGVTLSNLQPPAQADIDLLNSFDGNRPERTPAVNVAVTPSIVLPGGRGEIYGRWQRIGRIFADISNSLELPGYDLFSAGVLFQLSEGVMFSVSVENITDTVGLTEGNPRGGFVENTGSNFYFARPVNGRNAVASLRLDF